MSQYSQRHWRFALVIWALLLAGCSGNEPVATVVSVESIAADLPQSSGANRDDDAVAQSPRQSTASVESDPFADIYSSFTSEMEIPSAGADEPGAVPVISPIEYLYEISGGLDVLSDGVPSWLTGDRFMRFLEPVAFAFYQGEIYILDAGRHVLFKYEPDGDKLYSKMNLKDYLLGVPAGLTFDSRGYYFVTEPQSSRVLKFNPADKLVGVYKDKSNLSSPERIDYHEATDRLYIADGVYSRVMIASQSGKLRFAIGSRGAGLGEFIRITDFLVLDDGVYIADRLGAKPLQLLGSEGGFKSSLEYSDVSIPAAITFDESQRLYVADQEDDTIKIFVNNKLSWSVGGPGRKPGQFRAVTQMKVHDGKLYVLDSQNRRIQVFQINDV